MTTTNQPLRDVVRQIKTLNEKDFIIEVFPHFKSEFDRLKNARSTVETSYQDTPTIGNPYLGSLPVTPSQLVYEKDYAEVNRTMVSILCLKWLIDGNYHAFTSGQPAPVKMTEDSFNWLCELVKEPAKSPDQLTALLIAIVVGDIGKDPDLEHDVAAALGEDSNHDEIVYQAAEQGLIEPLNLLPRDLRKDVILGLKVGSSINVPQLAQAENVPGSLKSVDILKNHDRAFLLKYIEIILDVAGAGGHIDSSSAVRMIEPVFQAYAACRTALQNIIAGRKTIRQGYDQVLQQRGKLLESKGVQTLRVDVISERALLRLMCMARVDNRERAELIINAFDTLRNTTRQHLIDGLSVDGLEDGTAIVLYYMPGLFAETFKVIGNSPRQRKVDSLRSLMRFMTRVYDGSKPQPGAPGKAVERPVGKAAEMIRSDAFKSDPEALDKLKLPLK